MQKKYKNVIFLLTKVRKNDACLEIIYFHLQEHKSARHLVQDMQENDFAKQNVAPDEGISRSSFSEAINHRGLEQLQYVFENLYKQASAVLPNAYEELGDLVSIDGSLITAVLSMFWADYREGAKKPKRIVVLTLTMASQRISASWNSGAKSNPGTCPCCWL